MCVCICMLALELCILYTFVCIRQIGRYEYTLHARACVYGKVRGSAAACWLEQEDEEPEEDIRT